MYAFGPTDEGFIAEGSDGMRLTTTGGGKDLNATLDLDDLSGDFEDQAAGDLDGHLANVRAEYAVGAPDVKIPRTLPVTCVRIAVDEIRQENRGPPRFARARPVHHGDEADTSVKGV